jgi:predicted  nucleic acid-binding Zn-ribbon protein
MSQSQILYRLQTMDAETAEAIQRTQAVEADLGESAALLVARQKVAQLEGELARWRAAQKDLDLEVRELTEKVGRDEKRLYSGRVTNPKELAGLQEGVAALKRRRGAVEDKLLEAMLMVDETQEELIAHQENLIGIEGAWRKEQQALTGELSNLRARLEKLKSDRAGTAQMIPADTLALYEELRCRKGGRAVVLLKDGSCQGCGVSIPTSQTQQVRSGRSLVFCGSCGRILHADS